MSNSYPHQNGLVVFARKVGIITGALIAVGTVVSYVHHIVMDATLAPIVRRIEVLAATDTMIVHRLEVLDARRETDFRSIAEALAHPLYSDARNEALERVKKR